MPPVSTRPCAPRRTASKSFPARSKTRPPSAVARATSGDGSLKTEDGTRGIAAGVYASSETAADARSSP